MSSSNDSDMEDTDDTATSTITSFVAVTADMCNVCLPVPRAAVPESEPKNTVLLLVTILS